MSPLAFLMPIARSAGIDRRSDTGITVTAGYSPPIRPAVSSFDASTTMISARSAPRWPISDWRHCVMHRYPFTEAMTTDSTGRAFGDLLSYIRMTLSLASSLPSRSEQIVKHRHQISGQETGYEPVPEADQA